MASNDYEKLRSSAKKKKHSRRRNYNCWIDEEPRSWASPFSFNENEKKTKNKQKRGKNWFGFFFLKRARKTVIALWLVVRFCFSLVDEGAFALFICFFLHGKNCPGERGRQFSGKTLWRRLIRIYKIKTREELLREPRKPFNVFLSASLLL